MTSLTAADKCRVWASSLLNDVIISILISFGFFIHLIPIFCDISKVNCHLPCNGRTWCCNVLVASIVGVMKCNSDHEEQLVYRNVNCIGTRDGSIYRKYRKYMADIDISVSYWHFSYWLFRYIDIVSVIFPYFIILFRTF